jgi:hypothetical protein
MRAGDNAQLGRSPLLLQLPVRRWRDLDVGEGAEQRGGDEELFHALGKRLGRTERVSFGQGGFVTTNGSVVVTKDWKVLLVDVSRCRISSVRRPPRALVSG